MFSQFFEWKLQSIFHHLILAILSSVITYSDLVSAFCNKVYCPKCFPFQPRAITFDHLSLIDNAWNVLKKTKRTSFLAEPCTWKQRDNFKKKNTNFFLFKLHVTDKAIRSIHGFQKHRSLQFWQSHQNLLTNLKLEMTNKILEIYRY